MMYIVNTTFCADPSLASEVKLWCCTVYADEAAGFGFSQVMVSQVINAAPDADAVSVAVQMQCDDTRLIDQWFDSAGAKLIDSLRRKYADKVLPFTTYMMRLR